MLASRPRGRRPLVLVGSVVFGLCFAVLAGILLYPWGKTRPLARSAESAPSDQEAPESSRVSTLDSRVMPPRLRPFKVQAPPIGGSEASPDLPKLENPGIASASVAADELAGLRRSGPARDDRWGRAVEGVFKAWKSTSQFAGQVEFSDFQCFKKGCSATAVYPSTQAMMMVADDIRTSDAFHSLNSAGFRSGPIPMPSGQVKTVWILYSDDNRSQERREKE